MAVSKDVRPGSAGNGASAGGAAAAPGPSPAAFTLVHYVSGKKSALFPPTRLMNPVTYLGRTPGNDVVLGSDNVSRRHAKLVVGDAGVTVHDLDSHNGLFLNGKKVRSTPLNIGDLLYVADICIELKRSPDADQLGAVAQQGRAGGNDDVTGEEDPALRALATLLRATDVVTHGDEEAWAIQAIEMCRELTEATVAVLVTSSAELGGAGGVLETPVVLQPESSRKGEVPVLWPVVRKALDDGAAQFSADLKKTPISKEDVVGKSDVGAIMCVPITVDGRTEAAIYLARPSPGQVFTDRELETVGAIAMLFALRRRPGSGNGAMSAMSGLGGLDMEPHADILTAQAKAEAAEEKLREAQADVRSLTERIHGLEGDALKLKQQIELEKQNAIEAKREADRGRNEAHKLEQGLHKTDEDVKKLKDALVRSEEERQKLRERLKQTDEDGRRKADEIERLKDSVKAGEEDREHLRSEIAEHLQSEADKDGEIGKEREEQARLLGDIEAIKADAAATKDGLEKAVQAQAETVESLKQAMRATVPPMLADHVENAAAEGRSLLTDVTTGPAAALFVDLFGFDAWAQKADSADVKKRLDHYCNAVVLRVRANGGRVQQVLGTMHLLLFPSDASGVRAAVRCGIELQAIVATEAGVGVVQALHVGASSSGFFGDGDSATLVETGEALLVARGTAHLAHEPCFFATQQVQKLVAGDAAFAFALAGPAALVGGPTVVLYKVSSAEGGNGS